MAKKFVYLNSDADYEESAGAYEQADFIDTSTGVAEANKPVKTDASGKIDTTLLELIGGNGIEINGSNAILVDLLAGTSGLQFAGVSNNKLAINFASSFTIDAADSLAIQAADLASTASGEGASIVGIEDANSYYTSQTVEGALAEAAQFSSFSSIFMRAGDIVSGVWLLSSAGIPSNKIGNAISMANGEVREISVRCDGAATCDVRVYEHDGNLVNLTTLATVSLSAATSATATPAIAVTNGKQLAAQLISGSAKNVIVNVQTSGSNL